MLKIEHLKKTFSGKTILDDISLEVKSGEIVSIIGPSGTGKTTLLRCVNFLEKPDRGTITIDEVTADAEHSDGKQSTGWYRKAEWFQSYNLFHNKTVLENVMEAQIIVKKRSRKEAEEIALEKLKEVGMLEWKDSYPSQFPADSSNGRPSPEPLPCSLPSCFWMSQHPLWTRSLPKKCWRPSGPSPLTESQC